MTSMGNTRRMTAVGLAGAALAMALGAPAQAAPGHEPAGWRLTRTDSDARFRGLAAVDRATAWAAGSQGTVLRTTDGGR
ncbi:oxidoreductase, partial [Streptomyces sp. NPDC054835]